MAEIGKYIWLEDIEEHGWVPVRITQISGNQYTVEAKIHDDIIEYELNKEDIEIMEVHHSSLEGVDDLIELSEINEQAVLHTTRTRFYKDQIYTFIGDRILLSFNPFKILDIYNDSHVSKYKQHSTNLRNDINYQKKLGPHLFSLAEKAISEAVLEKKDQIIIVSGESGSGKTESSKFILKYLLKSSEFLNDFQSIDNSENIERLISDVSPLLEAFGNAKTEKNNNSSRYCKIVQLGYSNLGKIVSAEISALFLEKSRVIRLNEKERNYHVFYQLLYGSNEQEVQRFQIKEPTYFKYLNSGLIEEDNLDDVDFNDLKKSMIKLKFKIDEINSIFSVLMGILYLGNIEFLELNGKIQLKDNSKNDFKISSDFLGLDSQIFYKILTSRKSEDSEHHLSTEECASRRDYIAMIIYNSLFEWIIQKINSNLNQKTEKVQFKISIYDFFGPEIKSINYFEDFCRNYTNEKISKYFMENTFKKYLDEYILENIDFPEIPFKDNELIIELIDNTENSIFSLLEENKGLYSSNLKDQVYGFLGDNTSLIKKDEEDDSEVIVIKHTHAEVEYNVEQFILSNEQNCVMDSFDEFIISKNKIIKSAFSLQKENFEKDYDFHSRSVSIYLKEKLNEIIQSLKNKNSIFVKCIKPNNEKCPGLFNAIDTNRQLLSEGILEVIQQRKQGYSTYLSKIEFINKYILIFPKLKDISKNMQINQITNEIVNKITKDKQFQMKFDTNETLIKVGLTKIFMNDEVRNYLDYLLYSIYKKKIILIQSIIRMYKMKIIVNSFKSKVIKIQRTLKRFLQKKRSDLTFKNVDLQILFMRYHKLSILFHFQNFKYTFKEELSNKKRSKVNSLKISIDEKSIEKPQLHSLKKKNKKESNNNLIIPKDLDNHESSSFFNDLDMIFKKKKKGHFADKLKEISEIPANQIIEKELKDRIDNLLEENNKLNQFLSHKEKENLFLKQKITNYDKNFKINESIRSQIELIEINTEKLKSGLKDYQYKDIIQDTESSKEELIKLKKSLQEKEIAIVELEFKVKEKDKANKTLSEICDMLKLQIKRKNDLIESDIDYLIDQSTKSKSNSNMRKNSNSPKLIRTDIENSNNISREIKSRFQELKNENLILQEELELSKQEIGNLKFLNKEKDQKIVMAENNPKSPLNSSENQDSLHDLSKKIEIMKYDMQKKELEILNYEEVLGILKTENEKILKENSGLKTNIKLYEKEDNQIKIQKEIESLKTHVKNLEIKIEKMNEKIKIKNETILNKMDQNYEMVSLLKIKENELSFLKQNLKIPKNFHDVFNQFKTQSDKILKNLNDIMTHDTNENSFEDEDEV